MVTLILTAWSRHGTGKTLVIYSLLAVQQKWRTSGAAAMYCRERYTHFPRWSGRNNNWNVMRMAVFGGSGTTGNTDSNTSREKHWCLCSTFRRANITTTLNFFVQEYLTLTHVTHVTDSLNTESGQESLSEPQQRPPPPEPVAKEARLVKFYERRSRGLCWL